MAPSCLEVPFSAHVVGCSCAKMHRHTQMAARVCGLFDGICEEEVYVPGLYDDMTNTMTQKRPFTKKDLFEAIGKSRLQFWNLIEGIGGLKDEDG